MPTADSGDDFIGVCGPDEWLWCLVGIVDEAVDGGPKFANRSEDAALQTLPGQFRKISLYGIEPGAGCGREVEEEPLVAGEPGQNGGMLVSGIVVENDMDGLSGWNLGIDRIEEAYELLMAVALHAAADHLALQNVERREERRRAVALVIMGHGAGAPLLHGKPGLGTVERLDLALLVERKHDGMGRRIDIEPHHVAQLLHELRIVGEFELLDLVGLKPVCAPDAKDRAGADAASLGHHHAGPVASLPQRLARCQRHDARGHLRAERRNARGPRLVAQQARNTLLHEPFLPAPDAGLGLACLPHDLVGPDTVRRKQHDLGTPDMLLRRVAVLQNCLQPLAVRRLQRDRYARSHPPDSHRQSVVGIPFRIQVSGVIH